MSNPNRNQQIENNQPEMQGEAKTHTRNTNLKCKQNLKPNPIIMGKPQLTQLPNYQNYQNAIKVKTPTLSWIPFSTCD